MAPGSLDAKSSGEMCRREVDWHVARDVFAGDPRRTTQDTEGRTLLRRHNLHAMRQQATALNGIPVGDRRRMVRQWVEQLRGCTSSSAVLECLRGSRVLTGWRAVL